MFRCRHTWDIALKSRPDKLLKLNRAHYEKLKTMFERNAGATEELEFKEALYSMLARYNTLLGHGMQVRSHLCLDPTS